MATYNTVGGFVQFEPSERKTSGQTVRDVIVQAIGSGGRNVKITVWPEFGHVPLEKGDLVFAQGKFTQEKYKDKEYLNLSASDIAVNGVLYKKGERAVDNEIVDDPDEDSPF